MRSIVAMACYLALNGAFPQLAAAQGTAASVSTQYVEIDGSRIGYRSIGSGTPLVLLTRLRGTLDTWDPLFLDQLAEHHRVITLDYPGTGYSTGTLPTEMGQVAAFVSAFATKIGVTRFAVLGWSWGGLVSQALLLDYPKMVSHAVLVGTTPPGPGQSEIQ